MSRHLIATAHDAPYREMAEITLPSVQIWTARHDYGLWYDPDIDPVEKDACKARMFLEAYNSGLYGADDVFMWLDTDALVMNSAVEMESLQALLGFHRNHFGWAFDWNGPNSGVWVARFTSHAAHFIRAYNYRASAMGWGDNEAMNQTMLLPPFNQFVSCISGKMLNCNLYELHGLHAMAHKNEINNYEDGDFILHLAGVDHATRIQVLREYAQRVV